MWVKKCIVWTTGTCKQKMRKESQAVMWKSYNLSLLVRCFTCVCCFCVLHNAPMKRTEEKGSRSLPKCSRDTHVDLERTHSAIISVIQTIFIPQTTEK